MAPNLIAQPRNGVLPMMAVWSEERSQKCAIEAKFRAPVNLVPTAP